MGYAIYCRISRDRTGEKNSIERQEADCIRFAKENNLPVDETYTDNDISAYSGKTRPAYRLMMDRLKDGQHSGIIVWHVDRLYRRVRELEELVDLVEEAEKKSQKVMIHTVKAGDLDLNTSTGRMIARIVVSLANYEVERMVERILLSQRARAVEGRYRGGYVPYGYKLGDEPGTLEIDPDTAPIVQEITRRILTGEPILSIVKDLNRREIPTQNGKAWRTSTVRRTVSKPSIAGLSVHNDVIVGKAQWEPLITEDEWRAVEAILSDPSRRTQQGNLKRWQGAGVYECGKCGGKMITSKQRRTTGTPRNYQCGVCGGVSRSLDPVDSVVNQVVLTYLNEPENQLKLADKDETDGAEIAALVDERRQKDIRRARLGTLLGSGAMDEDQFVNATAELRAEIERIDDRLLQLRRTSAAAEIALAGDELAERWEVMSADMRGRVIGDLMRVVIMPARKGNSKFDPSLIRIEWK